MYCASDKTIPGVSSSQSSKNVKDGKFLAVTFKPNNITIFSTGCVTVSNELKEAKFQLGYTK